MNSKPLLTAHPVNEPKISTQANSLLLGRYFVVVIKVTPDHVNSIPLGLLPMQQLCHWHAMNSAWGKLRLWASYLPKPEVSKLFSTRATLYILQIFHSPPSKKEKFYIRQRWVMHGTVSLPNLLWKPGLLLFVKRGDTCTHGFIYPWIHKLDSTRGVESRKQKKILLVKTASGIFNAL